MAQLETDARASVRRIARVLSRNPAAGGAVVVVALLLAAAVAFGAWWAGGTAGVTVERGQAAAPDAGSASADAPDGAGEPRAGEGDVEQADDGEGVLVVDVAGAVASPSVVELPAGARVRDAIEAAGGLAPDADPSALNRAAPLSDGQQVYVPRQGEAAPGSGGTAQAGSSGSGSGAPAAGPVNVNTAGADELDALPGIGPATAQAIIEDREANGPFATVEDLMRVSGIGEKKFAKLEGSICV